MTSNHKAALMQIALDGPSASGKSTVGAMLAERCGCHFLDTGMMYRAVTYIALQKRIPIEDSDALGNIAAETKFSVRQRENGDWRLCTDGQDITDHLYSNEINFNVSPVSAISAVRRALVQQQRNIASQNPIVMAGRDIGTVVLPNANTKIYLTASTRNRAERRTKDPDGNAEAQQYQEVLKSVQRRDEIDSNRSHSPLRPADDAIIITTDDLTPDEVVEVILSHLSIDANLTLNPQLSGGRAA